jgi:hypothetical protein
MTNRLGRGGPSCLAPVLFTSHWGWAMRMRLFAALLLGGLGCGGRVETQVNTAPVAPRMPVLKGVPHRTNPEGIHVPATAQHPPDK